MKTLAYIFSAEGLVTNFITMAIYSILKKFGALFLHKIKFSLVMPLIIFLTLIVGILVWYFEFMYMTAFVLVWFGVIACSYAGFWKLGLLESKVSLTGLNQSLMRMHAAALLPTGSKEALATDDNDIQHYDIDQWDTDTMQLLELLKIASKEAKPLLSYIARVSAYNLTTKEGEVIRLESYQKLLAQSLTYASLKDITFFSRFYPSKWYDWGSHQIESYFADQKRLTDAGINIRRYMIGDKNKYDKDPMRKKFVTDHKHANIDLFFLQEGEFPEYDSSLINDMGVFLGDDGYGWIVQLNMKHEDTFSKIGISQIKVVLVTVQYGYHSMQSCKDGVLDRLFKGYWRCNAYSQTWKNRIKTTPLKNYPSESILTTHKFSKESR